MIRTAVPFVPDTFAALPRGSGVAATCDVAQCAREASLDSSQAGLVVDQGLKVIDLFFECRQPPAVTSALGRCRAREVPRRSRTVSGQGA